MTAWTEGYVSDIPYSLGFYRETMPAHIAFAVASIGKHPGLGLKPQRVLELGFGMGLGFIVGAAANPGTHFEGVDFNPQHVAHARGLADEAALTNVSLREASFQDLAREAHEGQQDLDLIILHGILTWVSAEAHEAIVEIARKRLKAGGLLYVSYNCMPGWAPVLPLQRLMRENAKRIVGRADQQTGAGVDLVKALMAEGARFFPNNPSIPPRIEKMGTMDKSYLAHEYLNANWFIFHFADVAAMFSSAKLSFLGSATLAENFDVISVPEGSRGRIAAEADPVFRETLRDFTSNKQFRRDLFGRGIASLSPVESLTLLMEMRFALTAPRVKISFKMQTNLGEIEGRPELYGPVADVMAERPVSFAEIAALPVFGANGYASALQTVALLIHAGQVVPVPASTEVDPAPAHRLNRVLIDKARSGRFYNFLAAPQVGSAVQIAQVDLLILASVLSAPSADVAAIADDVLLMLRRLGMSPTKDGATLIDPAEQRAALSSDVEILLRDRMPFWRGLGVL